jgi:hypothetical protein
MAATRCGVTVSTKRPSAPALARHTDAPASAARSNSSGGQPGSATTSVTLTPASSASASSVGPSMT